MFGNVDEHSVTWNYVKAVQYKRKDNFLRVFDVQENAF